MPDAFEQGKSESERGEHLQIHSYTSGNVSFSHDEVLEVLHNALELLASGQKTDEIFFDQTPALPYIYPLLVFFGIIPGDKVRYTTRRVVSEPMVCSCCGRRADYVVRKYADLIKIAADIEKEERSKWDSAERTRVDRMEQSRGRIGWDEKAREENAAIRAFDQEGKRSFCTYCAQTIRMALEDGELPHVMPSSDLSFLSLRGAKEEFERYMEYIPENVVYKDLFGRRYTSESVCDEDGTPYYFFKETDAGGIEHAFACCMHKVSTYKIFDGVEIHRLTKAGKYMRDYTGTDYEFSTGLEPSYADDENEKKRETYIGFLELINKIRALLRSQTLEWHKSPYYINNAVGIDCGQCTLKSTGEMKVVYVDSDFD